MKTSENLCIYVQTLHEILHPEAHGDGLFFKNALPPGQKYGNRKAQQEKITGKDNREKQGSRKNRDTIQAPPAQLRSRIRHLEFPSTCKSHNIIRVILFPDLAKSLQMITVHRLQWCSKQCVIDVSRGIFQVLSVPNPGLNQRC